MSAVATTAASDGRQADARLPNSGCACTHAYALIGMFTRNLELGADWRRRRLLSIGSWGPPDGPGQPVRQGRCAL